ncbi:MAG: hypothetical protein ACI8XC_002586 [Gammaproteobacteria bacterium]|jgi:hypothetical protein
MIEQFLSNGWCLFEEDPAIIDWVKSALPVARDAVRSPVNSKWLRCGETWFAGVNVLPNDTKAAVPAGPELSGKAVNFVHNKLKLNQFEWDNGQISVCYPGYPRPMAQESESAFQYRRDKCAAHLDGLLPEGPDRRRHLREFHGFILAIPLVEFSLDAAPFVVWEKSHEQVRAAFRDRFKGIDPEDWGEEDVTETYHVLRRQIFEQCRSVEIAPRPGQSFLVHRLALHGVSPWRSGAVAGSDGRMICYFRPEMGNAVDWLNGD